MHSVSHMANYLTLTIKIQALIPTLCLIKKIPALLTIYPADTSFLQSKFEPRGGITVNNRTNPRAL